MKTTSLNRFCVGLALTLAATAYASAQIDLITNGNFEDPAIETDPIFREYGPESEDITGWTVTDAGVQVFEAGQVVSDDPHPDGGGQKLQLSVGDGALEMQGGLTQMITLEIGSIYTISFDYRARESNTTGDGIVTFTGGATPQVLDFVGTEEWQNFTFTSEPATGTSGTLSFLGVNPGDSTDNRTIIDNVSVVLVP